MAKLFSGDRPISLAVFTGDQVYVEATAGLFDPASLNERYLIAYERWKNGSGLQRMLSRKNVNIVTLMDDHEAVGDNWEPLPDRHGNDKLRRELEDQMAGARQQYLAVRCKMWPSPAYQDGAPLWATRDRLHGYDFFFADTRTEREGRWIGNFESASIMSTAQAKELRKWIASHGGNVPPSFIVSPAILLPRRLVLRDRRPTLRDRPTMALYCDSWCGYPSSLHAVLAWLYEANAHRVVFLSGDEHLGCVATIEIERLDPPGDRKVTVHSIHAPALYAPYPFANATKDDFIASDDMEFSYEKRSYRCHVEAEFPPIGDGFVLLQAKEEGGKWKLDVEFDLEKPPEPPESYSLPLS